MHTPPGKPRVAKLSGRTTTYPRPTSSRAQRSGAPLEVVPSPLQSCMITTAGKGPGPSGFDNVAGISSGAPLGVVVMMDTPVPAHPVSTAAQSHGARAPDTWRDIMSGRRHCALVATRIVTDGASRRPIVPSQF